MWVVHVGFCMMLYFPSLLREQSLSFLHTKTIMRLSINKALMLCTIQIGDYEVRMLCTRSILRKIHHCALV